MLLLLLPLLLLLLLSNRAHPALPVAAAAPVASRTAASSSSTRARLYNKLRSRTGEERTLVCFTGADIGERSEEWARLRQYRPSDYLMLNERTEVRMLRHRLEHLHISRLLFDADGFWIGRQANSVEILVLRRLGCYKCVYNVIIDINGFM